MSFYQPSNPHRTPYVQGVVRGRATRPGPAGTGSWYVTIPRLHGPDREVGPCETPRGMDTIEPGDRLALVAVEGRVGAYIIVAHLR